MTDRKKEKKSKRAQRSQSCVQDIAPALPPRPSGGLRPIRGSYSFDPNIPFSLPTSSGFPMDSSDIPPPIPSTPRPKLSMAKPPAPLPPMDEIPPPLPPPLVSPSRSKHARQISTPTTPASPAPSSNTDPRYIKSSAVTTSEGATPLINAVNSAPPTEEQLRVQIEMQTQNTEDLRQLLEGKEEEALTPMALVRRYGKYFPFRATIVKGFYNNRAEIVAGEIYSIHFLKNARVIAIADSAGERYILPLNAAMRIGFEQLNQPSIYYNIIDIINSTEPPKLISPRDNYHGSDENSLKQDEVLLVKGVHLSRVRRIKSLIVMSIKTSKEKKLPSDCPVTFSTESTCNQITLSDAVHKVPELMPGNARLYPTVEVEDMGFPGHLVSETVRVIRHYHEKSLIATLEEQDPRPVDIFSLSTEPLMPVNTIYDIPLSLDIEFTIIPPKPEEDIYAYTHHLCQQFDPRKLQSGDGLGLNMALDEDNIYSGVELELPPYINYDPAAPSFAPPQAVDSSVPPPLPARRTSQTADSDEEYSEIDFVPTTRRLPSKQGIPPPLPSSLPPTTRPASADKPSPLPRLSPPRKSPRPNRKPENETTPTGPHPPHTSGTNDNGEYVDIVEDRGLGEDIAHATTHAPSPSPRLKPRITSNPPQVVLPSTSLDSTIGGGDSINDRRTKGVSPTPSAESYEDITNIMDGVRPRLPSPPPVDDVSTSFEEENEIMKQFSDLHSVVQSARMLAKNKDTASSPSHSTTVLKRLSNDLKRVSSYPQKIINHCMVLEREVSTLRDVVKDEMVRTSSSEVLQENVKFLETFSVAQVIKLLEMLNMSKYQDRFASEGIDGCLLIALEESILESNLGVTSKLDRIKLMKIIKGERSAKSVLEGQYNYVALQPRDK